MAAPVHPHDEERYVAPMDSRLVLRLLRFGLPYRRLIALAVVLVLVVTSLDLAGPLIIKAVIDGPLKDRIAGAPAGTEISSAAAAEAVRTLDLWALGYLGVIAFYLVLRYCQGMLMSTIGQKILRDVRLETFSHLQRMPMAFFDRNPVGRLVTRISNDVEALNQLFTSGVVTLVADVVVLSAIIVVLLWVNVELALVTLAALPFLVLVTFGFRYFARKFYREQRAHLSHLNAFTQESIQGINVIHLFARERENHGEFTRINRKYLDAFQRTVLCYSIYFPAIDILSGAALVAILCWGGSEIGAGTLSFGEFYLFWSFLGRFFAPIRDMAERYNVLQSAMAAAERLFKILDSPESIRNRPDAARPAALRGEIEFQEVSFAYGDAGYAVRDLSFRVEPGETVAIVGATGAGKSTIINLLTRFYEPQQGRILIDGADIRDYDKKALRGRTAVVLQDSFIFSRTVLENIRLGNPAISEEAAMEAAARVRADGFIRSLPGEYQARLKERGATISVGERQLLSFARALAHRPDILILDEATAHVDTATERLIQEGLQELLHGRTSIVIAHRLSTVQRANRILVLHKGVLRESGSHRELLARRGIYHRLYQLQFLGDGRDAASPAEEISKR